MKLIIAGSRDIDLSVEELNVLINKNFEISEITEVITGGARGVDTRGFLWADKYGIPVKKFTPRLVIRQSRRNYS